MSLSINQGYQSKCDRANTSEAEIIQYGILRTSKKCVSIGDIYSLSTGFFSILFLTLQHVFPLESHTTPFQDIEFILYLYNILPVSHGFASVTPCFSVTMT